MENNKKIKFLNNLLSLISKTFHSSSLFSDNLNQKKVYIENKAISLIEEEFSISKTFTSQFLSDEELIQIENFLLEKSEEVNLKKNIFSNDDSFEFDMTSINSNSMSIDIDLYKSNIFYCELRLKVELRKVELLTEYLNQSQKRNTVLNTNMFLSIMEKSTEDSSRRKISSFNSSLKKEKKVEFLSKEASSTRIDNETLEYYSKISYYSSINNEKRSKIHENSDILLDNIGNLDLNAEICNVDDGLLGRKYMNKEKKEIFNSCLYNNKRRNDCEIFDQSKKDDKESNRQVYVSSFFN